MDLQRSLKYALDRLGAGLLLLLLAPFLGVLAAAIRLGSPGSPFVLEELAGSGGLPFTRIRFRTHPLASHPQALETWHSRSLEGEDRQSRAPWSGAGASRPPEIEPSPVGRWLLRHSLAGLPGLINVALGEMSFVGPRPVSCQVAERYGPRDRRRLLFRPGLTGWASVEGGPHPGSEREIDLDLYYVDHFSLGLDCRILVRAIHGNGPPSTPVKATPPPEPASEQTPAAVALPEATAPVPSAPVLDIPATTVPVSCLPAPATPAGLLPLLVVGAGGHARVVVDVAEKQGRYRVIGLLDDRPALAGTSFMGYPVLGGRDVLQRPDLPAHVFVAIGSPRAREAWQQHLEERGFMLATLVHPSAQVGREVVLGRGTVLMAGAIVNSGSRLGRGVIVNTAASVDHDCEVGDFAHVAPGARLAGGALVGCRAHVGIASCVLQNVAVGDDAVVGGGAAVVRPVPDGVTVVGVPARPLAARTGVAAAAGGQHG